MRVALVIRSLSVGGAERQVGLLASELQRRGHAVRVMVFYGGGAMEAELKARSVEVASLGKRHRWHVVPFVRNVLRAMTSFRPDVIYTFLPSSNCLMAALRTFLPKSSALVCGVRASNMKGDSYDWLGALVAYAERLLRRRADITICNSEAALTPLAQSGTRPGRLRVVRNGLDTTKFRFDERSRVALRSRWGIASDEVVVGVVARLDPMKGHKVFMDAAQLVAQHAPNVRFMMIGSGRSRYADELVAAAAARFSPNVMRVLPERDDMPSVYSALDVVCLPSLYGEGFSNTLSEAMAAGRACVASDVGDSRIIVGALGRIVPPGDVQALAAALRDVIREDPSRNAKARTLHIADLCSLDAMVTGTEAALSDAIAVHRHAPSAYTS